MLDRRDADRTTRSNSLRAVLICVGAAVATISIPFVEHTFLYTIVCLLAACVIVPIWYDWNRGRLDVFAPIHVFGTIYFIDFGLGGIWTVQDPRAVAFDLHIVPFIPRAVTYCLIGYLALLGGYYLVGGGRPAVRQTEEVPANSFVILVAGGVGLCGYLALAMWTRAAWVGETLGSLVASIIQVAPLFLFAWTLAWLLFFAKRETLSLRLVLFGIFLPGVILVSYLTVSMKALVMVFAGVPVIARWYARRKLPWASLLVLLLLLVFVIFPFYNTFRWQDPKMDQTARLGATFDVISRWDSEAYQLWSITTVKRRMAMINSVALVIRDVPRWVPYAEGGTLFGPMLANVVPRILWPDKPLNTEGRDFGRKFRVTNYYTRETFIAPTIPGELFWNFDLPGIVIGMALLGVAMGWVYRRNGCGPGLDPVRRAVYVVMLVQWLMFDGGLASATVGTFRAYLLFVLLRWVGRASGQIETVPA